jgi:hypothetical protein
MAFQYLKKYLGLPDSPSTNPVNVEEQFDPLFFGTLDTMLRFYALSHKLVDSPIRTAHQSIDIPDLTIIIADTVIL